MSENLTAVSKSKLHAPQCQLLPDMNLSLSLMQLCSSICFISTMVACGAACHVRQLSHCGQILIPFLLRLGKQADATAAKLCHWPGLSGRKKLNLEQGRPTETATYIHDNPVRVSVGQKMKKHTFHQILPHLTHIKNDTSPTKPRKTWYQYFCPNYNSQKLYSVGNLTLTHDQRMMRSSPAHFLQ